MTPAEPWGPPEIDDQTPDDAPDEDTASCRSPECASWLCDGPGTARSTPGSTPGSRTPLSRSLPDATVNSRNQLPDRGVGGRECIDPTASTPGSTPGSRTPLSRSLPDATVNCRISSPARPASHRRGRNPQRLKSSENPLVPATNRAGPTLWTPRRVRGPSQRRRPINSRIVHP